MTSLHQMKASKKQKVSSKSDASIILVKSGMTNHFIDSSFQNADVDLKQPTSGFLAQD